MTGKFRKSLSQSAPGDLIVTEPYGRIKKSKPVILRTNSIILITNKVIFWRNPVYLGTIQYH